MIERLESYVRRTRNLPFAWGENDCALWVAGAIREMTGKDPAAAWRGAYTTKAEGIALAGTDHIGIVASRFEEIPVGHARPGDVVVIGDATLGIVQGRFAWAMTEQGLGLVPMSEARRAFRV